MKIICKKKDLDKLKKIYLALGLNTKKVEDIAERENVVLKADDVLKAEIKVEAEKPPKPPKDPKVNKT